MIFLESKCSDNVYNKCHSQRVQTSKQWKHKKSHRGRVFKERTTTNRLTTIRQDVTTYQFYVLPKASLLTRFMYCPRLRYLPVLGIVQGFATYQFLVLPKTSLLNSFMYCPRLRYLPVLCTVQGFAIYQVYVLPKTSLLTTTWYWLRYLPLLGTAQVFPILFRSVSAVNVVWRPTWNSLILWYCDASCISWVWFCSCKSHDNH